jgi:AcrR family transcriptional regulator
VRSGNARTRPPRLNRAQARERNRSALLDAAAEVFAARGFRAGTLEEVAEAAGLTKGAVYSQFANKEDLFAAAIERRYQERLEAFRALMERPGGTEARASDAALEFARSVTADADWALLFLEAWAEMLRSPDFGDRLRAVNDQIRDALEALLRDQLPIVGSHGIPSKDIAEMVLAMAHGFGIQHRLDSEHAPEGLFAEMMQIFTSGLAGTPTRAPR